MAIAMGLFFFVDKDGFEKEAVKMIDITNKQKGNCGLGIAIGYFSTNKTKYGNYQVALKSCGGTKGVTYKTVVDTNVDYLFIATDQLDMYLIPVEEVRNKSTLNLCDKYKKYKLN